MKALTGPECYQTGIFTRQAPDVLPYKSAIHPEQISLQQACEARESVEKKRQKEWLGRGVQLKQKYSQCQAGV